MTHSADTKLARLWLSAVALALLALAVYFAASIYLITYEDRYTEALGPFWSLRSMTFDQKLAYLGAVLVAPLLLIASAGSIAIAIKRTFLRRQ